jgi:hypothetical protein
MPINVNDITTAITLELDRDDLPIDQFKSAIEEFFGLVKEVAKESVPKKNSSGWLVKVYPGSAGIGVVKRPGTYTDDEEAVIRATILDGLKDLEEGKRPPIFTDKAIEHSKKLSNLLRSRKVPGVVRIWGNHDKPFVFSQNVAATAGQLLDVAYEDDGSVDGFLEKLNAHGQFEFVVYDLIDNHAIVCEVAPTLLKDAWQYFQKRVEVLGKVRYRRDGLPVSVKANEIISFPDKDEIPDLDTIRALLGNG